MSKHVQVILPPSVLPLNLSKRWVGGGGRKCNLEPSRFYISFFFCPPPPQKKKMKSDTLGVPQLTFKGGLPPPKKNVTYIFEPPLKRVGISKGLSSSWIDPGPPE